MYRCVLCALVLGAGLHRAAADSIIVVVYNQGGLALAADSRQIDQRTGAMSDTACKVLALGDKMVFAAVGNNLPMPEGSEGLGPEVQWTYGEARLAFNRVKVRDAADSDANPVEAVAQVWKEAIQEVLEQTFLKYPDSFVQMPQEGYLLRGVFGGLDAKGEISLVQVSVRPKKAPAFEVLLERLTPALQSAHLALGRMDIVDEFTGSRTERARAEASQQERELAKLDTGAQLAMSATRLVDLTIGLLQPERPPNQATIGGPIDLVELPRNAPSRWLQRKASCSDGK